MKITFRKDTGAIYGVSPEFDATELEMEELHDFASNEWEEVPEAELFDDELLLWFNSENEYDFQQYIDGLREVIGKKLPPFDEWKLDEPND